jgi:1-deoxy-D-xylulose-5-phosphate reductoisomerase
MKKKIVILGSTGSIGKTLLNIISKDRKNFEIILLTADTNYKLLYKQAKNFNVKNLIITNTKKFNLLRKINKKKRFEYL